MRANNNEQLKKELVLSPNRALTKKGTKMNESSRFLTLTQAADFLNFKVSRIRYEVFLKRIPHMKIGRSIRFSEKDLITWVLNQKQEVKNG